MEKVVEVEKVNVRLELVGEEATKFELLKNKRGLTQNTQLVRQLLKEAQEKELKEEN